MSDDEKNWYRHRNACDVIYEMKQMYKTYNFSGFLGSLEELQAVFSSMEAALGEKKDLIEMHEEWSKLRKQIVELRHHKESLTK